MGAVTPIGIGVPAFTRALREGRSGIRLLPADMPGWDRIRSSVAAMCVDFDPASVMSQADQRRLPRLVPMALAAARQAAAHAGLLDRTSPESLVDADIARRVGLVLGTGAGGIDFTLDQASIVYRSPEDNESARRQPSLWTITNATHGNLAGELSIRLGLRGPSLCISTGCASSSDAIGMAMDLLRSDRPGTPDAMVVVGADAHVRWETLLGMELLRVISTRDFRAAPDEAPTASRPFDRTRDGFVLGEGAWALVLEREAFASRRGAPSPLGRLLGYGCTCDAFHRVRPAPDMEESARAMRLALQDAGLEPEDIDLLHYHGTATALNDALETQAVKMAFGEHAPKLRGHSVKGAIGHPQGACGAAALVATLGAMTNQDGDPRGPFALSTVNLREQDIEGGCDLDYTPHGETDRSRGLHPAGRGHRARLTAMINCLAFGAKNSTLVVGTFPREH